MDIRKIPRPLTFKFSNGVIDVVNPCEKRKYDPPNDPKYKQDLSFNINSVTPIIPWYHSICKFNIKDNAASVSPEYPHFMRKILNDWATEDGKREFMYWFGYRYLQDPMFRLQTDGCIFVFKNGIYDGAYLPHATIPYTGTPRKISDVKYVKNLRDREVHMYPYIHGYDDYSLRLR